MMDIQLLKDKNVIVTGCARGMGNCMMKLFAKHGANLWACARTPSDVLKKEIADLQKQYEVLIEPLWFDLTDYEAMKIAVKQIMSSKRPVHGLVNNAGITINSLFQMTSLEDVHRTLETNFIAPYLFTQYIVKLMIRNGGGSIVNIASSAAEDGNAGRSIYGASKAALICATKSIAEELGDKGVRANAIAPGVTQTDMLSSMTQEVIDETVENTDMKRLGQPLDVANAAMFLLSDKSSYITGQVLRVDGCLQ